MKRHFKHDFELWSRILDPSILISGDIAQNLAERIKLEIEKGNLKQGTQIFTQDEILVGLRISKTTAEAAYLRLKIEGYTFTTSKGTFVKDISSKEDEQRSSLHHGKKYHFNLTYLPTDNDLTKKMDKMIDSAQGQWRKQPPNEKAIGNDALLKKNLSVLLNISLGTALQASDVSYMRTIQNAMYNIVHSFLKEDEFIVMVNPVEVWMCNLGIRAHERMIFIGYDRFGPSSVDLMRACNERKVGILLLDSRSSCYDNKLVGSTRTLEILKLHDLHQFLMIETDKFATTFTEPRNTFITIANEHKANYIYIRHLTSGYFKTAHWVVIGSNASNIEILESSNYAANHKIEGDEFLLLSKALENNTLVNHERATAHKLSRSNALCKVFLLKSELWKNSGILNSNGMFFYLELATGKLPEDIFHLLHTLRVFIVDPDKFRRADGLPHGIILSIGNYISTADLEKDINYFHVCIRKIMKLTPQSVAPAYK